MKKPMIVLAIAACLVIIAGCSSGCKGVDKRLEAGGAYNRTVTNTVTGTVTNVPNGLLFSADLTFKTLYGDFMAVSDFEFENRAALWKVSHQIKHDLDVARPKVRLIRAEFYAARKKYLDNPTPEGLNEIQRLLKQLELVSSSIGNAVNLIPR